MKHQAKQSGHNSNENVTDKTMMAQQLYNLLFAGKITLQEYLKEIREKA